MKKKAKMPLPDRLNTLRRPQSDVRKGRPIAGSGRGPSGRS
jgi:hypothetical protein